MQKEQGKKLKVIWKSVIFLQLCWRLLFSIKEKMNMINQFWGCKFSPPPPPPRDLDLAVSPGGDVVSSAQHHPHQPAKETNICTAPSGGSFWNFVSPVEGDADQLLSPLPVELDDEEAGAELGQALPGLDEVHLGLDQVEVLDVGVCLKDLLSQLWLPLVGEPRGDVILNLKDEDEVEEGKNDEKENKKDYFKQNIFNPIQHLMGCGKSEQWKGYSWSEGQRGLPPNRLLTRLESLHSYSIQD